MVGNLVEAWRRLGVAVVALVIASSCAAEAAAQPAPAALPLLARPGDAPAGFDVDDANIATLAWMMSRLSGRRFILGEKLRPIRATVRSADKVTPDEAYAACLAILQNNGMTVVPQGRDLKIVEHAGGPIGSDPIYGSADAASDEPTRVVTRLHHLGRIHADEAAKVLSGFRTPAGDVATYAPSNLLVLTDTAANLERLLRIAAAIDVDGPGVEVHIEPINYASATALAVKLGAVLGPVLGPVRIVADECANALIIVATEDDYRRLLDWLNRVDIKASADVEVTVVPIHGAICKELLYPDILSDRTSWRPRRDVSRRRGLVEEIRQEIMAEDEKERREEEAKPKRACGPHAHPTVSPPM